MEDWALIRRLAAEGVPHAAIARRLGISRTTVIKAVKSEGPPKYERTLAVTSFAAVETRVRGLLTDTADMPATVIAERVGWTGSSSWLRDNVARIRPDYQPRDPADRIVWEAGDAAQCDLWFPPKRIPLENGTSSLLPVLVITLAYSRFVLGRMIPTKTTEDLLLGMWLLLQQLGRVPRRLIWDNERGIGRGRHRSEGVPAFMGTLATRLVLLPPRDPESKGVVERRNEFAQADVAAMECGRVRRPAMPDAGISVGGPDVALSGLPVVDDVDAFHALECDSPIGAPLSNNRLQVSQAVVDPVMPRKRVTGEGFLEDRGDAHGGEDRFHRSPSVPAHQFVADHEPANERPHQILTELDGVRVGFRFGSACQNFPDPAEEPQGQVVLVLG
ncbi:MAG: helix-turn-helix domain-containing protein [Micropruina sp.]|uniref:helix-turn-helix domain-containing protein n=1 Tax=Micropruina sp. TaxID=2737536 RepID=UPI0039E559F3